MKDREVGALTSVASAHAATLPTWDHQTIDESAEGAHFEIDTGRIARRHAVTAEGRPAILRAPVAG